MSIRPRWLVVVPQIPRSDQASGDRRLDAILKCVAKDCDIFIVTERPTDDADSPYLKRLEESRIQFVGDGAKAMARTLIMRRFDAAFFEFYSTAMTLAPMVRSIQPECLVIVDSVDLHYLREREAARLGTISATDAQKTETLELDTYNRADITVIVSEAEKASLLTCLDARKLVVIPNVVPIVPRTVRARNPELLFVGGFKHQPNKFAVEWFHENVWSLIRKEVPAASWIIAGSSAPLSILSLDGKDGIKVAGFVPSTDPLLDSAQVSIAPLTFGGGMKGKVSEALAAGLPVVTTKWGAQGLEVGAGEAFLVADSPEDFAQAVVKVLSNEQLRASLSTRGQALALATCSLEAATPGIRHLIQRSRDVHNKRTVLHRALAFAAFGTKRVVSRFRRTSRK
jgi:glycosyltransferase involved in cell wall biosynthesis